MVESNQPSFFFGIFDVYTQLSTDQVYMETRLIDFKWIESCKEGSVVHLVMSINNLIRSLAYYCSVTSCTWCTLQE